MSSVKDKYYFIKDNNNNNTSSYIHPHNSPPMASITIDKILAPLPATTRGQPTQLSSDPKGERLAYAVSGGAYPCVLPQVLLLHTTAAAAVMEPNPNRQSSLTPHRVRQIHLCKVRRRPVFIRPIHWPHIRHLGRPLLAQRLQDCQR